AAVAWGVCAVVPRFGSALPGGRGRHGSGAGRRPSAPADAAVRLSDWSVVGRGASRSLRLDFPGPVSGAIEASFELVPRGPWRGAGLLTGAPPQGEAAGDNAGPPAYKPEGGGGAPPRGGP